eukprot:ANDGO_04152.mRNA.1 COMM domain-containing protein 4
MRFKFCGDADLPDWVLAAIARLSELTSVRTKLLGLQVVGPLVNPSVRVDPEKISRFTAKFSFTPSENRQCLAALAWILSAAARFGVEWRVLADELQQVGFPKEHAESISRTFRDNREKLRDGFQSRVLVFTPEFDFSTSVSSNASSKDKDRHQDILLDLRHVQLEDLLIAGSRKHTVADVRLLLSVDQTRLLRDELVAALGQLQIQ